MITEIKQKFGNEIIDATVNYDIDMIILKKEIIIPFVKFLKSEKKFNFLMDLFAVDYLGYLNRKYSERFEIVYNFYSFSNNKRLIIKALVSDKKPSIDSITSLYFSADWYEREVYDMYGIFFNYHPNLKRILMYDEFIGHPLRKDYPINKKQPKISLKDT